MPDVLKKLAEDAIEIDEIRKMLSKDGLRISKTNNWLPDYISLTVYGKKSVTDIASIIGVGRSTMYNHILKDEVLNVINELSQRQRGQIEQNMFNLLDDSMIALKNIINDSDNDSARLKAIEILLKKFDIFDDKTKLEMSGSLNLPNIVINSYKTKEEDGE